MKRIFLLWWSVALLFGFACQGAAQSEVTTWTADTGFGIMASSFEPCKKVFFDGGVNGSDPLAEINLETGQVTVFKLPVASAARECAVVFWRHFSQDGKPPIFPRESRVPVKTERIHKFCECGGEYLFQDLPRTHKCNKCGKALVLDRIYPFIEFMEANP